MRINKLITTLTTATVLCSACGDFLDKQPSVSEDTPVTETSQLLALYDYLTNIYTNNYFAY